MTHLCLAAVVTAMAACASPTAAPTTAVASPSTTSKSASDAPPVSPPVMSRAILDIAPATLTWGGDHGQILALDASGYLSISHGATAFLAVPFARITAGGDLLRIDGTTLLTIDDAGTILLEGLNNNGFVVNRDGTASQRGEALSFQIAADGTVYGTDPKTGYAMIDADSKYLGGPASRRAMVLAKIAWAIWLTNDDPEAVPKGEAKQASVAACDAYRAMASKALACVRRDKEWTKRLERAISRVDAYAAELPPWGRDATASACELGASRLKAYLETRKCAL